MLCWFRSTSGLQGGITQKKYIYKTTQPPELKLSFFLALLLLLSFLVPKSKFLFMIWTIKINSLGLFLYRYTLKLILLKRRRRNDFSIHRRMYTFCCCKWRMMALGVRPPPIKRRRRERKKDHNMSAPHNIQQLIILPQPLPSKWRVFTPPSPLYILMSSNPMWCSIPFFLLRECCCCLWW